MSFFVLKDPLDRTTPVLSVEPEDASAWKLAAKGRSKNPLKAFRTMGGNKWKDCVWKSLLGPPIISERVVTLLRSQNISGWETFPVALFDVSGEAVPGYVGLAIVGRCPGRIDFDKRESAVLYAPSAKGAPMPRFRGLHFKTDGWDHSDLFMDSEGTGWILVTEKVANLFSRSKVSNCTFKNIATVEMLADEREIVRGL
jgi:hypothetical protein